MVEVGLVSPKGISTMVEPYEHDPQGIDDGDEEQKTGIERIYRIECILGQEDGEYGEGEPEEKAP